MRFVFAGEPTIKGVKNQYFYRGELPSQGWVISDPEGNKTVVKTGPEPEPAKSFKLIAYTPGCQLVTLWTIWPQAIARAKSSARTSTPSNFAERSTCPPWSGTRCKWKFSTAAIGQERSSARAPLLLRFLWERWISPPMDRSPSVCPTSPSILCGRQLQRTQTSSFIWSIAQAVNAWAQ